MPDRVRRLRADFIDVLDEVSPLLARAYEQLGPVPGIKPQSAFLATGWLKLAAPRQ